MDLALERAFAPDLVGLAADQHGHYIARGQSGIDLDLLVVHFAEPRDIALGQFQAMRLAVHYYVVGHANFTNSPKRIRHQKLPADAYRGWILDLIVTGHGAGALRLPVGVHRVLAAFAQ